jgi:hypothetical protein
MIRTGILTAFSLAALTLPAAAQYCADYNDGSQSCGIPTFQMCLQSVSGVGGNCITDNSSQIPPNLMQRWLRQQNDTPPAVQNSDPMPPPPLPLSPSQN